MNDEVHITWHDHQITRSQREHLNGHHSCVIWLTGLSGSGKSTIANCIDRLLYERHVHSFVLDVDNIRHGLNASSQLLAEFGEPFAERFGLGFSPEDRRENIRRVGTVAQLFASAGIVTLVAFVSPYRADRDYVRRWIDYQGQAGDFVEVLVDAPLDVCQSRDPKGLYRKARAGQLRGLTGVDAPYERPEHPEITLHSAKAPPEMLARQVLQWLISTGKLPATSDLEDGPLDEQTSPKLE